MYIRYTINEVQNAIRIMNAVNQSHTFSTDQGLEELCMLARNQRKKVSKVMNA